MNRKQLTTVRNFIRAAEILGSDAAELSRDIAEGIEEGLVTRLEVETPEWFDESEYETLSGDAGKANSDWFRVLFKVKETSTEVVIFCPTFLRGHLKLSIGNHGVSGVY